MEFINRERGRKGEFFSDQGNIPSPLRTGIPSPHEVMVLKELSHGIMSYFGHIQNYL